MSSAELQAQLWGAEARDWAKYQESPLEHVWRTMLDSIDVRPGTALVDLGCGAGGASKLALQRGARVSGLDAAPQMIEIAREVAPEGEFRIGDLENLPYDDNVFDAGLAANSIQFAGDPVNALREIGRVCRPGKSAAIAVWGLPENCDARLMFEAVVGVLPEKPSGGGPFALSMPGVLDALMDQAGLTPIEEQFIPSEMAYDDLETAWRAMRSAGPLQGAIRAAGEAPVRDAVHGVLRQFQESSGRISLQNEFKVVIARV